MINWSERSKRFFGVFLLGGIKSHWSVIGLIVFVLIVCFSLKQLPLDAQTQLPFILSTNNRVRVLTRKVWFPAQKGTKSQRRQTCFYWRPNSTNDFQFNNQASNNCCTPASHRWVKHPRCNWQWQAGRATSKTQGIIGTHTHEWERWRKEIESSKPQQ